MSTEPYRVFTEHGRPVKVDFDGTCQEQHEMRQPPLFHVKRSETSSAYLVRCPRSLTADERAKLTGGKSNAAG